MKNWKTILALTLMWFALVYDWGWFWAAFILLGLIHVIRSGEIHFVEAITKRESPLLFWIMVAIWTLLAIYSMAGYLNLY